MIVLTRVTAEGARVEVGIKLENVGNMSPSGVEGISWFTYFDKGQHHSFQIAHSPSEVQEMLRWARTIHNEYNDQTSHP